MFRGRVWLVFFLLLARCARPLAPSLPPSLPPSPGPTQMPETSESSASPAPEGPGETPTSEEPIRLLPRAPLELDHPPHVEVKFPLAGKRIGPEKAPGYVIRVKTESWSNELGLMYLLDDFAPRVFKSPAERVTLGQLVPEDAELSPGEHHLFVAAVDPNQGSVRLPEPKSLAPFSDVEFWIGDAKDNPPTPSTAPRVVCLSPSGTYNGSAGEHILVDYRVLGLRGSERDVEVEVSRLSPGNKARGRLRVRSGQLVTIEDLQSGDYVVTVRLLDTDGNAVTSPDGVKSRTITVNRDAPEPG